MFARLELVLPFPQRFDFFVKIYNLLSRKFFLYNDLQNKLLLLLFRFCVFPILANFFLTFSLFCFQDLEFHGVMRFYFQDSGQKVATKCIRVASDATTTVVIETLIEKFRPDMRMLSIPEYALYEIHENGGNLLVIVCTVRYIPAESRVFSTAMLAILLLRKTAPSNSTSNLHSFILFIDFGLIL